LASQTVRQADTSSSRGVQVIARAASILRLLEERPEGLTLAEIARDVGLARSTVQRILAALASEDFVVEAQPGRGARIGPGLARIASSLVANVAELLHAYLVALRDEFGETVDLSILSGGSAVFIDQIPGRHRLVALSAVGERFPLHCTAKGKALLAALDRRTALRMLPSVLHRYTPHTLTGLPAVEAELDKTTEAGVAYDVEEATLGICAAAIAVREPSGALLTISVVVPAQRFGDAEAVITRALRQARGNMSAAFSG